MFSSKPADRTHIWTQARGSVGGALTRAKRGGVAGSVTRYTVYTQIVVLLAVAGVYLREPSRFLEIVAASVTACVLVIVLVQFSRHGSAHGLVPYLADKLTILRFMLVVPVVVLLIDEKFWPALAAYIVSLLTDAADGVVARRRGQTTKFGAVMDPLADIVSTAGVFGALLAIGLLPPWVFVILCVRYGVLFAGSAVLSLLVGPIHFRATAVGKIVGVLQAAIAIIIIVLAATGQPWQQTSGNVLFPFLGVIFSSVIVSQIVIGIRHLRQAPK